ncbi:copper chaperone PCu(A)C [Streptomyces olivaceus]|uniref:copper chaperone PCu(A)C n=1 Tax=Streptomyces olivaceus TaxID=47716 RepID=UPI003800E4A2
MKWIPDRMPALGRLDRRRLRDGALAALVPVAACSVTLAGLTAWAGTGRAGSPARMDVAHGLVLLPSAGVPETAAFFDLANEGGSADTLVRVTARGVSGEAALSRHRMGKGNSAYRSEIDSVSVAAGGSLTMSPHGVDLTVPVPSAPWQVGDLVTFTLEFRRGGPVEASAVVVRPGAVSFQ